MKRFIIYLGIFIFLVGCESVLDIKPTNMISEDDVKNDPVLVDAFLNKIYNSTRWQSGSSYTPDQALLHVMGGEMNIFAGWQVPFAAAMKIIDENGEITKRGVKGELCTRGYSVMKGYWGDEIRTKEAIDKDGWMHTGDLATLDDEGYCNIVGRVKDMVIRGGENVYPREVEEYFYRHPKIQDAQVFGVPDEKYGEELCIWICLKSGQKATEEEMKNFCKGQIAHYKIPRYIYFVEAFPMTVTGKIQKFIMRDEMIERLGLSEIKTA